MADDLTAPVLICGMHRSHTSVFTQWLHSCGLHVGERFADASTENPTGYWEDLDFVNLQESILKANSLDAMSTSFKSVKITDEQLATAKTTIHSKSSHGRHWGWKDPRTCVLYDQLWREILSDHFVIGLYRPFREVVTSLLMRTLNDKMSSSHYKSLMNKFDYLSRKVRTPAIRKLARESQLHNYFLEVWIAYNSSLLKILMSTGEKYSVLIKPDDGVSDDKLIEMMTRDWQIPLKHVSYEDFWRPRRQSDPIEYNFDQEILNNAVKIDDQLQHILNQSELRIAGNHV
jgi:hypothetical protein